MASYLSCFVSPPSMYYYDSQMPQGILHISGGLQRYSFGHLHVESQENGGKDTFNNQDSLYFLAPICT